MRVESTDIEKKFLSIATVGAQGSSVPASAAARGRVLKKVI